MPRSTGKEKFCFPIVVEKQENGYFAYCPSLSRCFTDGPSYEIVMDKIKKTIEDELAKLRGKGDSIPSVTPLMLSVVEVEI